MRNEFSKRLVVITSLQNHFIDVNGFFFSLAVQPPWALPSALQLRVCFGFLNNLPPFFRSIHPSEADYVFSEQFSFYSVRLLVSRPTPNLEDQGIPLRLASTPCPVRQGWPYQ
jgi:hypothetical protein